MKKSLRDRRGVALTVVLVVAVLLTLISGFVLMLGYNKRRLTLTGGRKAQIYFHAKAGMVDAMWRIRTNYTNGLAPAGSFTTPAYNPNAYSLDTDGNGTMDVTVDIGSVGANGVRTIQSNGLDA